MWKTVTRSELKEQRNDHEDELLVGFAAVVPQHVRVTVVADRGFSDSKLYRFLTEELGFDYIIRFRGGVYVEDAAGERSKAKAWLGTAGRMRVFRHARVTAQRHLVPVVVCVQDKAMKEPWCLVSSRQDHTGRRDPGRLWTALHGGGDVQGREEPALWPGTQAGRHRTP